jgi:diaminohydroxyphosphoribosylaminopyrimidine deaminase / 5-amino-6-(5-phosphoribosylamino)uracil reductase
MHMALSLAQSGRGTTGTNPSVGCVIVAPDGQIIGATATARGGRPHAETLALAQAGERARGATLYVTLEPCAHTGQTPPCALAIQNAGIARVVVAMIDPDPRVSGRGIVAMQQAGIEVSQGVCEKEARAITRGFLRRIIHGIPEISLKLATSLNGMIADSNGNSRWITGEVARRHAHGLRASHDAIITGIGTVLADDPLLNCRISGREADSPIRVVLDTQLRMPLNAKLVSTADVTPTWILTTPEAIETHASHATELRERGVIFHVYDGVLSSETARIPISEVMRMLANAGVNYALIEAGSTLSEACIAEGIVDRIYWYRAPIMLAGGMPALGANAKSTLFDAARYLHVSQFALDTDRLDVYEAAEINSTH